MTETPAHHPRFHFWGPLHLLGKPTTAFLCSTRCPAEKVAEIYQWARQQCEVGGTVISGFHTPVEQDALGILARRGANALWVPARSLPKSLPKHLQPAFDEGRLTILSPYDYGTHPRASRATGSLRNGFVLDFTRSHYLPHIAPGSALAADAARQAP